MLIKFCIYIIFCSAMSCIVLTWFIVLFSMSNGCIYWIVYVIWNQFPVFHSPCYVVPKFINEEQHIGRVMITEFKIAHC